MNDLESYLTNCNLNGLQTISAYKITKSFRYIPSWVSISLEIVCNPFKLQFVKYDSRSFMNTAKRNGYKTIFIPRLLFYLEA
jgi:hypothetical protein